MGMCGVCSKIFVMFNVRGKAIPLQAWTGPGGSRNLRLPGFMKVVALVNPKHQPPLPLGNILGAHFY
jgi:hypothetical protein